MANVKLTKTQQELITKAKANRGHCVSVCYGFSSSRRSNNSFGLREIKAARKLVELGIFSHDVQDSEPYKDGSAVGCFKLIKEI